MREIIEILVKLKGKDVDIHTDHKFFGKQHIQMKFIPETEIGIGFRYKEQIIYIDKDDVVDCCIEHDKIIINGSVMRISITHNI